MAQNLMVWLMEPRVVLEERAVQLRKQLDDTESEVARLGAAEVVYQQYQEDAEAGHPDAAAWQQALEEATGGAVTADCSILPGQAACRYSCITPASRSRRRMSRREIRSGSLIGSGTARSGAAWFIACWGRWALWCRSNWRSV